MDSLFATVDKELSKVAREGPYFLGKDLSMVDIMFSPFLERMAASLPYFKGYECRHERFPHLLKWYEAMDSRLAYRGIKSDYVSKLFFLESKSVNLSSSLITEFMAVHTLPRLTAADRWLCFHSQC